MTTPRLTDEQIAELERFQRDADEQPGVSAKGIIYSEDMRFYRAAHDLLPALLAEIRDARRACTCGRGATVQCEEHEGRHIYDPASCVGAVLDATARSEERT